jgi:hypothetical protein
MGSLGPKRLLKNIMQVYLSVDGQGHLKLYVPVSRVGCHGGHKEDKAVQLHADTGHLRQADNLLNIISGKKQFYFLPVLSSTTSTFYHT